MLDLTAIKARRNLLPPGQFIATLGSGEHVCTAIYAEQDDGTKTFIADFWPDYELKLTPVRHAMSTMKAFMAYPADIDSLIAEVERLQTALTTKDSVLSQFANSENWGFEEGYEYLPPQYRDNIARVWRGDNPIELASQALSEDKE